MSEKNIYDKWVLASTGDMQSFYAGKLDISSLDPVNAVRPQDVGVKNWVGSCIEKGVPLKLVNARLFMTFMRHDPSGNLGIMSQLVPISGANGPVEMMVKPSIVLFPSDMPGMEDLLDKMSAATEERELEARARNAGLHIGRSTDTPQRKM